MVFHWSLRDNKSHRISRTHLSILVDLNNAVVWMVSIRPPISNLSSPLTKSLGTVTRAPITIGITVILILPRFLSSFARSKYFSFFSFFSFSLIFTRWSSRTANSTIRQFSGSGVIISIFDLLAGVRWSVCISKSLRIFCVYFSKSDSGLQIYHLLVR